MNIHIRKATSSDKEFLIDAVAAAEKSGAEIISYCNLFNLNVPEFRTMIADIFDLEVEDQELFIPNFLIAEVDGEYAGAISSWIEKLNGTASNIIKGNLFYHTLGLEKVKAAKDKLDVLRAINIDRKEHALQLECVYTVPKFRGNGIARNLIEQHIVDRKNEVDFLSVAEIQTLANNVSALKSYNKLGFQEIQRLQTERKEILDILPSDTRILLEKSI
jgi:ribosomal protein S18 acetylase RimI-like enzyme